MPCYNPREAFQFYNTSTKKTDTTLDYTIARQHAYQIIKIKCKKCVGCRLDYSIQWGVRGMHEASLYEKNCWLTLTYNDENLPLGWNYQPTLVKKDHQNFFKRFRYYMKDEKIRYLMCGEYGEKLSRPHYHVVLFGFDFEKKKEYKKRNGYTYYTSPQLDKIWGLGHAVIAEVNFLTVAYTARYALKKINGDMAEKHYDGRQSEYIAMSLKPGIAFNYYEKNKNEIYIDDYVEVNGYKRKPPLYYDKLYEKENAEKFDFIKFERRMRAKEKEMERVETLEELEQKQKDKIKLLKRIYETDEPLD